MGGVRTQSPWHVAEKGHRDPGKMSVQGVPELEEEEKVIHTVLMGGKGRVLGTPFICRMVSIYVCRSCDGCPSS